MEMATARQSTRPRSEEEEGSTMKLLGAILVAGTTILGGVQAAQAGSATDAALGLGAFAVFNQLVRGETIFHSFVQPVRVVVQPPVVVAAPPPVVAAPPPVVYVTPPAPVVYQTTPPVVYWRAPAYYAPRRIPSGPHKKVPSPWRGQYRPY
jgi:hypothetical protein